jgi:two-component system sensor histidine kinase YesM
VKRCKREEKEAAGKSFRLRSRLWSMVTLYGLAGFLLPASLEMLFLWSCRRGLGLTKTGGALLAAAVLTIQAGIFVLLVLRFRKKVYEPIVTVEKVIHKAASGTQELWQVDVEEDNELYVLYQDLNSILTTLEDLVAKESKAVLLRKQAELDALQSQINPHFLYNTLESIRGQAMVYGIQEIEVMTKALANLFRYSISSEGSMVPFSMELKNIDNYLLIQRCRFNNRFEKVDSTDKDTLDCMIPKLLVQPIVENAIHHGLEPKLGSGTLTILSYRTRKRLVIHVVDDGLGMEEKKAAAINEALRNGASGGSLDLQGTGTRVGILNVHERIRLAFGPEYGLHIYSTEGVGTDVEIVLPVLEASGGAENIQKEGGPLIL